MLRLANLIRRSRLADNIFTPAATLTLFHNSNSRLSNHLLERLFNHESRYLLDVRTNKLPLYETYRFIHEECVNMHPQNARSFERVFPALLASPEHLFCDRQVKHKSRKKQFVPDLELVQENNYLDKVSVRQALELSPFVVDWANKLVAVDDEGLDRIMQHYLSCGTQNSAKVHFPTDTDNICAPSMPGTGIPRPLTAPTFSRTKAYNLKEQSAPMMCAVHPHVAEFADLF